VSDGSGLFIEITPSGGKLWRLAYRYHGRQKTLALGGYPAVTLHQARAKAIDARRLIAAGTDPAAVRREEQARLSFGELAESWYVLRRPHWGDRHAQRVRAFLDGDLKPLAPRRAAEIRAQDILDCLRGIERRGALAQIQKAHGVVREVLAFAVAEGQATHNPAQDMSLTNLQRAPTRHHAALTDPAAVGGLLRAIRGHGTPVVRHALELLAHLFCRPGELRLSRWGEFDLDAGRWEIPTERMKMREPHAVPLSPQAVALLRELYTLRYADDGYVLPGLRRSRPISDATLCAALRTLGYGADVHQPHGFRATARTLLSERLHEPSDWIERQLAHSVPGALRGAYARAQYWEQRVAMMGRWSDYLDKCAAGLGTQPA
jgi:integrase